MEQIEANCPHQCLAFGKKLGKTQEWFEANSSVLNPIFEENRTAMVKHKPMSSHPTQQSLKAAQSKTHKTARCWANGYWLQVCECIHAVISGHRQHPWRLRTDKKSYRTHTRKAAPFKSATGEIIKDKSKQLDRWVEYYS